ncbi:MAG: zinc ribbon domain-containing protein [Clostridia bacterium]|jgi:hypothetical protein|nr:zinc ribbon domain-containing protein [Clostridia bacterium]
MFFVGIFGINQTEKPIGTCNNTVCPSCGALTRLEVYKRYSYFHLFFIPTFKWNVKYYAKSSCCGSIYELDPSIGAQYEKGINPEIRADDLRPIHEYQPFKTCPNCRTKAESDYSYCPYCGQKF